jgi:hypothetical protein
MTTPTFPACLAKLADRPLTMVNVRRNLGYGSAILSAVNKAPRPGRLWACFLPSLLRLHPLLGRLKIRFGPEQSSLRVSEQSRPPAREACVARGNRRLQPTFAGEYRRSATFPDRRGIACLRMLVTDGRCTGSFGGRSVAAHFRLVIFRGACSLHLRLLGVLQIRGSRINLAVCASLLAGETPRTRIAAR